MKLFALSPLAAVLVSGCGGENNPEPAPTQAAAPSPTPSPTATATPFSADFPGPDNTDPRALVDYWRDAVQSGEREAARRAWRADVRVGGMAPRWAVLKNPTVTFGEGREEGAAGSVYYTIPLRVTGTNADKIEQSLNGTMRLRRANDVDGATPEQLSWRIDSIDWEG